MVSLGLSVLGGIIGVAVVLLIISVVCWAIYGAFCGVRSAAKKNDAVYWIIGLVIGLLLAYML